MTSDTFLAAALKQGKGTEVERACLLAFHKLKTDHQVEFNSSDVASWFADLSYPTPNVSRLNVKLSASKDTIRGAEAGSYRLHRDFVKTQEARFPNLGTRSQEVNEHGTILPEILYSGAPGYIQSLCKQINASFEANIFDGCAVLMRRLEEGLLILSYENLTIQTEIQDGNGLYKMLEAITKNAAQNKALNLSRNSKTSIETFRELGNYSAHKITYTCKREYIAEKLDSYRALIDELLHKAGIKK